MKILIIIVLALALLFCSSLVEAVPWSPQGNINLKDRYNITNDPIGDCPIGQVVQGKNINGTWNCTTSGSGDITGVTTDGPYLEGGCLTGTCNLLIDESVINSSIDNRSSILNVNSSGYWDNLNSPNATQMENSGGILNILESWITSLFNTLFGTKDTDDLSEGTTNRYDNQSWNETRGNDRYVNIDGDTMIGDLNMSDNDIVNVKNITAGCTIWENGSIECPENGTFGGEVFSIDMSVNKTLYLGKDINTRSSECAGALVFDGSICADGTIHTNKSGTFFGIKNGFSFTAHRPHDLAEILGSPGGGTISADAFLLCDIFITFTTDFVCSFNFRW